MSAGWTRTSGASQFGFARLFLLIAFVVLAGCTYFLVDAGTIHSFLLRLQKDPYGYLHTFLLGYTLSVVVLFPCMILQVMSGALYGFWGGMAVSWVSTSAGQALAFLLGRYLFRPTVKSYLHSTWPTFPVIDAAIKKEGWKLVCLLRLSPVLPYNVLNYALAITPVSFWVFTAASAVATIPWTALYVYIGTFSNNIMDLTQGKISYGSGDMYVVKQVITVAFIIGTTIWGYRVSQRAIMNALKEAAGPEGSALLATNGGGTGILSGASSHGSGVEGGLSTLVTTGPPSGERVGTAGGLVLKHSGPTASSPTHASLLDRDARRLHKMLSHDVELGPRRGI